MSHTPKSIDVVFDGPPGPEAGRFVEVEDSDTHRSIRIGKWIEAHDGLWILRIPMNNHDCLTAEVGRLREALAAIASQTSDGWAADLARHTLNPEEPK